MKLLLRNPAVAAFLSFVLPGLGQAAAGKPRRGAIVAELSVEDAEEIYAMRVALESLAARHAARVAFPEPYAAR